MTNRRVLFTGFRIYRKNVREISSLGRRVFQFQFTFQRTYEAVYEMLKPSIKLVGRIVNFSEITQRLIHKRVSQSLYVSIVISIIGTGIIGIVKR